MSRRRAATSIRGGAIGATAWADLSPLLRAVLSASFVLLVVLSWSCGRIEPSADAAVAPPPLAAPAAPERLTAASAEPGCYLGVVLPSESVEVVAEVAGRVREVAVRPGDAVAAGALLAVLEPDDLRHELAVERAGLDGARSALAEAEVEVRRAGEEHRRRLALAELVSRESIDAAAFELEAAGRRREHAAADLAGVRAKVERIERELAHAEVRAPFAGTVAVRHVDPGGVVVPGAPLLRLIGGGTLRVRFAVPPEEAERLRSGQPLTVELESPPLARRATLERLAPEIDAASRTVFAEARLAGPRGRAGDGPPAGALVRVSSTTPGGASCFARPELTHWTGTPEEATMFRPR
jgi:RND family efflux transporter MFP subunit